MPGRPTGCTQQEACVLPNARKATRGGHRRTSHGSRPSPPLDAHRVPSRRHTGRQRVAGATRRGGVVVCAVATVSVMRLGPRKPSEVSTPVDRRAVGSSRVATDHGTMHWRSSGRTKLDRAAGADLPFAMSEGRWRAPGLPDADRAGGAARTGPAVRPASCAIRAMHELRRLLARMHSRIIGPGNMGRALTTRFHRRRLRPVGPTGPHRGPLLTDPAPNGPTRPQPADGTDRRRAVTP